MRVRPPELALLWALRMLVRAGLLGCGIDADDLDTGLLRDAGVEGVTPLPRRRLREALGRRLGELETGQAPRIEPLSTNVAWLAQKLGASEIDAALLAFAIVLEHEDALKSCFQCTRNQRHDVLPKLLAAAFERDETDVRRALGREGVMVACGLIERDSAYFGGEQPLGVPHYVQEIMNAPHESAEALLERFVRPVTAPRLTLDDFAYIADDVHLLDRYLAGALAEQGRGANVLLHGPAGTGKTELARALVAHLGARGFETPVETREGEMIDKKGRLAAFRLCQRFAVCGGRAVVVFDECEDAFPRNASGPFGGGGKSDKNKGWLVRMLEDNAVPAIWIGNHAGHIDPAFLRRFDLVVELRTPPPRVRRRIVAGYLGASAPAAWLDRLAHDERISPAHVERAARVARRAAATSGADFESTVTRALEGTFAAQGLRARGPRMPEGPCTFDVALLNPSMPLAGIVGGLRERPRATLLLYGVPGTGKTAFAHHLAAELGKPLCAWRASDLLSCWLGETEANLARAFREARDADAVLLLDEVDGFLQERGLAVRSWEVTQVNELLVQMEAFEGILVCATNLVTRLDAAAFRRFAFKIRFDPLGLEQRIRMFQAMLADLGARPPRRAERARLEERLASLDRLTPGDFAAVARQARIVGGASAATLLDALVEERRHKSGSPSIAGFMRR